MREEQAPPLRGCGGTRTVEDAGPYKVDVVFSGWMRKTVRVVQKLTAKDAKADDQWSSLRGYADKRGVGDAGPYGINVIFAY